MDIRYCPKCKKKLPKLKGGDRYGKQRKFCSRKCRRDFEKELYISHKREIVIARGTVGAISELEVSCDLMKKGFDIFRAMSPSASCDLIILKNKLLLRIEATTGYRLKNNKLYYPKKDNQKSDCIAVYDESQNQVYYFPSDLF